MNAHALIRISAVLVSLLAPAAARAAELPSLLSDTGLYAGPAGGPLAADVMGYTPQYPLWTDGASKRRWIALPAGTAIDASDPDHWRFPVGTRLWKEFAFEAPVETRFMELQADGRWSFATYVWNEAGDEAVLAPERGVAALAVGDDQVHDIPGRWDCRSCHGGRAEGVLGFGALQLSRDRDPLAPHAEPPRPDDVDLEELIARGHLVNLPQSARRPRIAAASDRERAVLGYFHGNCGGCHQADGALSALTLRLEHSIADDRPNTTFLTAGVVVPGDPAASALLRRMTSRDHAMQMPPLGTRVADREALALIDAWIREDLALRVASDSPNHEERSR